MEFEIKFGHALHLKKIFAVLWAEKQILLKNSLLKYFQKLANFHEQAYFKKKIGKGKNIYGQTGHYAP